MGGIRATGPRRRRRTGCERSFADSVGVPRAIVRSVHGRSSQAAERRTAARYGWSEASSPSATRGTGSALLRRGLQGAVLPASRSRLFPRPFGASPFSADFPRVPVACGDLHPWPASLVPSGRINHRAQSVSCIARTKKLRPRRGRSGLSGFGFWYEGDSPHRITSCITRSSRSCPCTRPGSRGTEPRRPSSASGTSCAPRSARCRRHAC